MRPMSKVLKTRQELPLSKGLKKKYQKVNRFHFAFSQFLLATKLMQSAKTVKVNNSTMTEVL